jgi:hypothetical protein
VGRERVHAGQPTGLRESAESWADVLVPNGPRSLYTEVDAFVCNGALGALSPLAGRSGRLPGGHRRWRAESRGPG